MIQNLTIRRKIILLTISVIVCAVMVSGTYFGYTYYTSLRNNAYEKLNSSISQAVTSISHKFEDLDNTSFAFFSASHMRSWQNREFDFSNDSNTSYNNIANLRGEIESSLMFNNAWLLKYIDSVYMFADNKCIYLVSRKAESLPQSQQRNQKVFEETKNQRKMIFYYLDNNTVYMIRRMNDIAQKKQLTLVFAINSESIMQELYQLDSNATTNIIGDGTVFFSNHRNLIGTANTDEQSQNSDLSNDSFVVHRDLYNGLFSIEISIPKSSTMNQVLRPLQNYIVMMLVFILLFAAFAALIASIYTRFIKDLDQGLNQVRNKNYDIALPDYRNTDLNNISHTFNSMASEIKTLINTVYKSKILLKDADIRLLQSQMNPHFLINTLTTISTTALLHNDSQIYHMVTALSSILDANLYNDNPFITVEKELKHIKCYLYIQGMRFQDKLRYHIHIESEDLLKLYIPRLSIEPLVENAVIHGIEDSISNGEVEISIHREGDDLLATVTDNGKGFNVEKVLSDHKNRSGNSHSIGVSNTNKRIKLLFGETYGIRFESEPWVRTCAYIRFPVLTNCEGGIKNDDQSSDCGR